MAGAALSASISTARVAVPWRVELVMFGYSLVCPCRRRAIGNQVAPGWRGRRGASKTAGRHRRRSRCNAVYTRTLSIREITAATGMFRAAPQGTADRTAVLPCRAETQPPDASTRGRKAGCPQL
ncbi:hypothetical protein D9M68_752920 [compost metagenome]